MTRKEPTMSRSTFVAVTLATLAIAAPALADDHVDFGRPRALRTAAADPLPAEPGLAPMPEPGPAHETTIFGLPKNVGTADRVVRTIIGLGLAGTGVYGLATGDLSDTTSGVLMGVSAVPFATAATGYCPLYQVLGIDTTF